MGWQGWRGCLRTAESSWSRRLKAKGQLDVRLRGALMRRGLRWAAPQCLLCLVWWTQRRAVFHRQGRSKFSLDLSLQPRRPHGPTDDRFAHPWAGHCQQPGALSVRRSCSVHLSQCSVLTTMSLLFILKQKGKQCDLCSDRLNAPTPFHVK